MTPSSLPLYVRREEVADLRRRVAELEALNRQLTEQLSRLRVVDVQIIPVQGVVR